MGNHKAKQKRDKDILSKDPKCYICGNDADSIDHQPPKSFFINKTTPQEFIFSCCLHCNQESREQDQIASIILSFPTKEKFEIMDEKKKSEYLKKFRCALSNSKEPFLSNDHQYIGRGYFLKNSGLIFKCNDGKSIEYRDFLYKNGYKELYINEYGINAIETIAYKLTCAIFKFQKNKLFQHSIGPQFNGRVFYSLQYIDMSDSMFELILKHFPLIAEIKHRQKSGENFGFRYNYNNCDEALLFSAYFGGQFVLNVLAFNEKFNKELLSMKDNPFDNGTIEQAGFREIKKIPAF